ILDHYRLPQIRREPLPDEAREEIAPAPGLRCDDAYRLGRILLRGRGRRYREQHGCREIEGEGLHASGNTSMSAAARTLELPAAALESPLEGTERLRGRGHEPAKSLREQLVHVLGAHVRVPARHLVLLADGEDVVDRRGNRGMLVLPGKAQVLREVAFA